MFSKIPTITILSIKLLIKSSSNSPDKQRTPGLSILNQGDPYELTKINTKLKEVSNNQKFVYAILKLKDEQIFVTQSLPLIQGKQLSFDKGDQGLLQNSNCNGNQSDSTMQDLISTFQLVTVNRGSTNRHMNDQYLCLEVWQYLQMELLGSYKIHLDLLKEGRTEYSSTFQGVNNASLIKFSLKFQKNQPKGFSNHKVSPYNLNGYYHSPSHFGQNTQRGNSLNNTSQKPYNPEKKIPLMNQYQNSQLKNSNLYIPSLRRVGSQEFNTLPSGRTSNRNFPNSSFNNEGYTSKYSISKPTIDRTYNQYQSKFSGIPSTRNNDYNQSKKISIKNRNAIIGNYRKSTESNLQSNLKL